MQQNRPSGLSAIPILAIVMGVMALGLIGWLVFLQLTADEAPTVTTVETDTNLPGNANVAASGNTNAATDTDATSPETGETKVYSNTVWGFSFRYPAAWRVITDALPPEVQPSLPVEKLLIGVPTSTVEDPKTLQAEPAMLLYVDPTGWGVGDVHTLMTVKKQNGSLVVTNEEATGAKPGEFGLSENYSVRVREATEGVESPRLFIDFWSGTKAGTSDTAFNATVKEILASFSFGSGTTTTPTTTTTSTADWKTYSSSKRAYSFQYPPTWALSVTQTYILVSDPSGVNGKFYLYPATIPTVNDTKAWTKKTTTVTVGGANARRTDYTPDAASAERVQALISFVETPSGWLDEHGLLLVNGSSDSSAMLEQMLSTFTFLK